MTRWIFLLALLANLALLGWEFNRQLGQGPATEALPPESGQLLRLDELPEPPRPRQRAAAPPADPPVTATPAGPARPDALCFELGPLTDESQARIRQTALEARGFAVSRRARALELDTGFWVYVEPSADRGSAERRRQALVDAGLREVNVVTAGRFSHALSLGTYATREAARARAAAVLALGERARLLPRTETRQEIWLQIGPGPAGSGPQPGLLGELGEGLRVRRMPCTGGAESSGPAG